MGGIITDVTTQALQLDKSDGTDKADIMQLIVEAAERARIIDTTALDPGGISSAVINLQCL